MFVLSPTVADNVKAIEETARTSTALLLQGTLGCGKTATALHFARLHNKLEKMIQISVDDTFDSKDLLGGYTSTQPGVFEWSSGPLTTAVTEGRWVLMEDIELASFDIFSAILPVIKEGVLQIPERSTAIPVHKEFKLIATQQLQDVGSHLSTRRKDLPFAELWGKVIIKAPTLPEIEDIVLGCASETPLLHDVVGLQASFPHFFGLRSTLKWARRVEKIAKVHASKFLASTQREGVLREALDAFCGGIKEKGRLTDVANAVGRACGVVESIVEAISNERPQVVFRNGVVQIGRVQLETNKMHLAESFAPTSHSVALMEKLAAAVVMNEPVLLTGETGVGKTFIVQNLAEAVGKTLVVHNLNQQTDCSDFMGGWKPKDVAHTITPLYNKFVALFSRTFDTSRNAQFVGRLSLAVGRRQWSVVHKFLIAAFEQAKRTLEVRKSRGVEAQEQCEEWRALEEELKAVAPLLEAKESALFTFEEGTLVKAWQNGDWILLDEINLAATEVLERVASVIGESDTLFVTERGDAVPVHRHPNFRLFANMNPPTDVGKKDLPPTLRSKFTEFFVGEPFTRNDLVIVTNHIVGGLISHPPLEEIVSFFLDCVKMCGTILCETTTQSQPPHYSLRTLTRGLTYTKKMTQIYGFAAALTDGLLMSFATSLGRRLHGTVEQIITKHLRGFCDQHPRLPKPPGKEYVAFEHLWLEVGPEPTYDNPAFILTSSVREHLKNLARAVTARHPVLLEGPTSSGKSSMVEYLAQRTGHRFVRVNNHETTEIQEYTGHYVSDELGRLHFVDGILVEAVRKGYWIVLDELNLAPSDVLEALNRLLDDNRELMIPETQETVKPHPHFRLFATQNPAGVYGGRKLLSRAFRNRFLDVIIDDIPNAELADMLCRRYSLAPSFAEKMVQVLTVLQERRQTSQLFAGRNAFITPRDLFRWAERDTSSYDMLASHGFMLLADRCRKQEERQIVKDVIESVMRVDLEESSLYKPSHWESLKPYFELAQKEQFSDFGIVWTPSMQRLFTTVGLCLLQKEPILLVGETGSSKTTVCQLWARLLSRPLTIFNCHQHTEAADFVGSLRPAPPEARDKALFAWHDGSLVRSMRAGGVFVLDEISLAEDSVLERLNSVLEPSRTLTLAECSSGERIVAAEAFLIMATMNPGGDFGKKELSPALRNRFTEVFVRPVRDVKEVALIASQRLAPPLQDYADRMAQTLHYLSESSNSPNVHVSVRDIVAWTAFMNSVQDRCDPDVSFVIGADLVLLEGCGVGDGQSANAASLRKDCCAFVKSLVPDQKTYDAMFWELCKGVPEPILPPGAKTYHFGAATTQNNLSKILRALQLRKGILLEGSPGVGKTSLVEALGAAYGHEIVRINLSDQTDMMDLLGTFLPCGGDSLNPTFKWSDGVLLDAVKRGCWVILDELNLANQSVLEGLNALLDHRETLYIPELTQEVHSPPGFRIFACQNPLGEGGGRKGLPKSFLNRFSRIHVDCFTHEDLCVIATNVCSTLQPSTISKMVAFVSQLQESTTVTREFGCRGGPWEFNLRDVLRWAQFLTNANQVEAPQVFVDLLFLSRFRSSSDKKAALAVYNRVFGTTFSPPTFSLIHRTDSQVVVDGDAVTLVESNAVDQQPAAQPVALVPCETSYLSFILRCVSNNQFVILSGPTGGGKSALLQTAALLSGNKLVSFTVPAGCDAADLLGGFSQVEGKPGEFAWKDSILLQAVVSGYWLVLQNANFCNPSVLDRLNPLVEPGGVLALNEQGQVEGTIRTLRPHPRFRLFATVDPKYGEMSRALRNRAVEMYIPSLSVPSLDALLLAADVCAEPNTLETSSTLIRMMQFHAAFEQLVHPQAHLHDDARSDAISSGAPSAVTLLSAVGAMRNATPKEASSVLMSIYLRNRLGYSAAAGDSLQQLLNSMLTGSKCEALQNAADSLPTDLLQLCNFLLPHELVSATRLQNDRTNTVSVHLHRSILLVRILCRCNVCTHPRFFAALAAFLIECSTAPAELVPQHRELLGALLGGVSSSMMSPPLVQKLLQFFSTLESGLTMAHVWNRFVREFEGQLRLAPAQISRSPHLGNALHRLLSRVDGVVASASSAIAAFDISHAADEVWSCLRLSGDSFLLIATQLKLLLAVLRKRSPHSAYTDVLALASVVEKQLVADYGIAFIRPGRPLLLKRGGGPLPIVGATKQIEQAPPAPVSEAELLMKPLWEHTAACDDMELLHAATRIFDAVIFEDSNKFDVALACLKEQIGALPHNTYDGIDAISERFSKFCHALQECPTTSRRSVVSQLFYPLVVQYFVSHSTSTQQLAPFNGAGWCIPACRVMNQVRHFSLADILGHSDGKKTLGMLQKFLNCMSLTDDCTCHASSLVQSLAANVVSCFADTFGPNGGKLRELVAQYRTGTCVELPVPFAASSDAAFAASAALGTSLFETLQHVCTTRVATANAAVLFLYFGVWQASLLRPVSSVDPMFKQHVKNSNLVKAKQLWEARSEVVTLHNAIARNHDETPLSLFAFERLEAIQSALVASTAKLVERPDPTGGRFAQLVRRMSETLDMMSCQKVSQFAAAFTGDGASKRRRVEGGAPDGDSSQELRSWSELLLQHAQEILQYAGYEDFAMPFASGVLFASLGAALGAAEVQEQQPIGDVTRLMTFPSVTFAASRIPSSFSKKGRESYQALHFLQSELAEIVRNHAAYSRNHMDHVAYIFNAVHEAFNVVRNYEENEARKSFMQLKLIEGDDEKHLKAFHQQYPTYYEEFSEDESAQAEEANSSDGPLAPKGTANVCSAFFTAQRGEFLGLLCRAHELVYKDMSTRQYECGVSEFDSRGFVERFDAAMSVFQQTCGTGSQLLHLSSECEKGIRCAFLVRAVATCAPTTRAEGINPHTESSTEECHACGECVDTLLRRTEELLHLYPDAATLERVSKIGKRLIALPASGTPLMKMVAGCEVLLRECYEWERNATAAVSLLPSIKELSALVLRWRRMELHAWPRIFALRKREYGYAASSHWFSLHEFVTKMSNEGGELHADDAITFIREFLWGSTVGEFETRVGLVKAFGCQMVNSPLEACRICGFLFLHIADYFGQFVSLVDRSLEERISSVERELRDFVDAMKWEDANYYAVRASSEKSHLQVFRMLSKLEDVYRQSIHSIVAQAEQQQDEDHAVVEPVSAPSVESSTKEKKGKKRPSQKRERSGVTVAAPSWRHECVASLTSFVTDLREEIVTTIQQFHDDKKATQNQKTRALKTLFDTTLKAGIPQTVETVASWNDVFGAHYSSKAVSQSKDCWDGTWSLFYKAAHHVERMREARRTPHADLSGSQVQRGAALCEQLLWVATKQRTQLVGLEELAEALRTCGMVTDEATQEVSQLVPCHSFFSLCVECVVALQRMAEQLQWVALNVRGSVSADTPATVGTAQQELNKELDLLSRAVKCGESSVSAVSVKKIVERLRNVRELMKEAASNHLICHAVSNIVATLDAAIAEGEKSASTVQEHAVNDSELLSRIFGVVEKLLRSQTCAAPCEALSEGVFSNGVSTVDETAKTLLECGISELLKPGKFFGFESHDAKKAAQLQLQNTLSLIHACVATLLHVHKETCCLLVVLARLFRLLFCHGFCKSEEEKEAEQQQGEDGAQQEGTGMDEGKGEKDVTDELENEDQLMSMKDMETKEQDEEQEGEDDGKAADVQTDFKGDNEARGEDEEEDDEGSDEDSNLEKGSVASDEALDRKKSRKEKDDKAMDQDNGDAAEEVPEDDAASKASTDQEENEEQASDAEAPEGYGAKEEEIKKANKDEDVNEDKDHEELIADDQAMDDESAPSKSGEDDEGSDEGAEEAVDEEEKPTEEENPQVDETQEPEETKQPKTEGQEMEEDSEDEDDKNPQEQLEKKKDENVFEGGQRDDEAGDETTKENVEVREEDNQLDDAEGDEQEQAGEEQKVDEAGRSWKEKEANAQQKKDRRGQPKTASQQKAARSAAPRAGQKPRALDLEKEANLEDEATRENENPPQEKVEEQDDFVRDEEAEAEGLAPVEDPSLVKPTEVEQPESEDEAKDDAKSSGGSSYDSDNESKKQKSLRNVKPKSSRNPSATDKLKGDAAEKEEEDEVPKPPENLTEDELDAWRRWNELEGAVLPLAQQLCEQLRLILAPTVADKLQGDYKTGKRINIKKIIPYIASQYKKDRIWLRRSKPHKRSYQVMIALDDSQSMQHNNAGLASCQSVALLCKALQQLEVGEFGVLAFGKSADVVHPLSDPWVTDSGPQVISKIRFAQSSTNIRAFLERALEYLDNERMRASASTRSTTMQLVQLMFIITDGQITENRTELRRLVARAEANRQVLVLIILDVKLQTPVSPTVPSFESVPVPIATTPPAAQSTAALLRQRKQEREDRLKRVQQGSIVDMQIVDFEGGKVVKRRYLEDFPFPFYLVVKDLATLPVVLADAMRQWFELISHA